MKRVILVDSPIEEVVVKLNKTVHSKVEIKDRIGDAYYFGGGKIVQDEFLWDSAKHVNNFFRIKGKLIAKDMEHTEIDMQVINKPSFYVIYALALWFLFIALLTSKIVWVVFAIAFVTFSWFAKDKYFEDVIADIRNIATMREE